MATKQLDTVGMRCPQPVLKLASLLPDLTSGDVVEVRGDCPTFEQDIRKWCERMKKTLLAVNVEGTTKIIQVQI